MRRSIVLLAILSGCASVKSTEIVPVSPKLREFKAVQVLVTAEEPGAERAVSYFRSAIISELLKRDLFVTIVKAEEPGAAEVRLAVALSGFRGVDPAARAFLGAAAGRPKLTASVTLTDLKTTEDLGAFFIYGKTAVHANAGTSNDVIDSVAIGVAEYLAGRRPE